MVYSWASRSMRPMKQGQHLQMREPDSSTNWGKDNWHRALPSLERISCLTSGSRMQILFVFRCEWCSPSCSRCQRPSFPWSNFWRVKLRKLQNSQYTACVKMMFEDLCVHSLAGPNLFAPRLLFIPPKRLVNPGCTGRLQPILHMPDLRNGPSGSPQHLCSTFVTTKKCL